MTEERDRQKKNQETMRRLQSGREDVIIETVQDLRDTGNKDILPAVIDLISSDISHQITDACVGLLNDLKDKSSAQVIAEELIRNRKRKNLDRIVAACWQNGLDYSAYIDLFIDMVMKEDYPTAIEAFTVVEENIHQLTAGERENKALFIEHKITGSDSDKSALLRELVSVVRAFSGPFRPDLN